jgi:CDP-diacylglycerol pyrophosphatase
MNIRRRGARSHASRIARLAASGRIALLCIGALAAFAPEAAPAAVGRGALWKVVEACLVTHALTGGAFPCLEVNVSGGRERGYVVLRPPLSASDLILAPTRRVAGVEDASLAAPEAPNYFEDAWRARKFLNGAPREPLPHDGVVLAVNSSPSRTQDQLHIHIGCLSPRARRTVEAFAAAAPADQWLELGRPFHGLEFRARLLVQDSLVGVNPFRLAAEAWPGASVDRSLLTIAVAGVPLPRGREGFVLLASWRGGRHSVEGLLLGGSDLDCR